ncbi:MAG: ferrous iron transport protein B [Calditrichaeota bacterium]|nr:ferrous iron transport protein B [Calditrichota bacterium]
MALIGNPNSGKTSVFNALTGLRQKVANYPGVTVEKKTGMLKGSNGTQVKIYDLPGLYSLVPKSLDDKIASDIITGRSTEIENLKLIVIVVDASNLSRNLYLVTQIIELGAPVMLALNMMDSAKAKGLEIDVETLAKELNITVVPLAANKRNGTQTLREKIFELVAGDRNSFQNAGLRVDDEIRRATAPICDWLKENTHITSPASCSEALRVLSNDKALHTWIQDRYEPNGKLQAVVKQSRENLARKNVSWPMLETRLRYQWIDDICRKTVRQIKQERSFSEKLDKVLTHRLAGPFIFLFIFALIFQMIFSWAEVPMNAIETFINWLGNKVEAFMPDGVLEDLLVNGAIAGVGAILIFLPQIIFLFFFLSLLENTGYMARVAFMMDRFMRGAGLSGRSVIPLLSSFACAIPGIMATRTIQNSRERLITIMIAPLMSCSARLPVYALMIGAFIPGISVLGIFSLPGLILLAMYLLGIVAAIAAAFVLKRSKGKKHQPSTFIMELPPYRRPSLPQTFLQVYERAKIFVTDAGKIILAISIVLWFLASYPKPQTDVSSSEAIKQSFAGQLGQVIEPVIKPLGFDWKIGIGLITSFAAREVLVSTLATIYNVEGADETSVSLREAMRKERNPETGQLVYTPLVALSLMVFFALACQCMSTVAVVRRETNSWRWPFIMIAYMTILAYLGSLVVFQGGRLLGLG